MGHIIWVICLFNKHTKGLLMLISMPCMCVDVGMLTCVPVWCRFYGYICELNELFGLCNRAILAGALDCAKQSTPLMQLHVLPSHLSIGAMCHIFAYVRCACSRLASPLVGRALSWMCTQTIVYWHHSHVRCTRPNAAVQG